MDRGVWKEVCNAAEDSASEAIPMSLAESGCWYDPGDWYKRYYRCAAVVGFLFVSACAPRDKPVLTIYFAVVSPFDFDWV